VKNFTTPRTRISAASRIGLKQTFDLINPHLYTVDQRIKEQAKAFDPAIEGYVSYALDNGGKHLRPALAILAGGATGKITSAHIDLAIILELIHMATLVHDDIIDGADRRRDQPTPNAKWGNTISVLLGDCLFSHALKLATNFSNTEISRRIADAATEVCSGEIIQTQRRFDLKLSTADYFRIIEMKTGALFAAAAELGAFISEASPASISALKQYGMKIGTAYQVYDDLLDIVGDEKEAGKTLGTDLRKGKLTLPLLFLLQSARGKENEELSTQLLRGEAADIDSIIEAVYRHGALKAAAKLAQKMVQEANEGLSVVPENRYTSGLKSVGVYVNEIIAPFAA
jgi:octaprenyl-diphosphate synthase